MSNNNAFNPSSFSNPNIVVKSMSKGKEDSGRQQRINQLETKIEKLQGEKKLFWFNRDDYNNTVREHQKRANDLRDKRNALNLRVKIMSNERKDIELLKDNLLKKKRDLGEAIDSEDDKKKKSEMFTELKKFKQELDTAFSKLKEIRANYGELRTEANDCHENMLVYRQLERQSRRESDVFHNKGKDVSNNINEYYKELKVLRKEAWKNR